MDQTISTELLTELDLGSGRGGRAGQGRAGLELSVVRALVTADLPAIQHPPAVAAPAPQVKALRHSHHRLAELLCKGIPQVEVSRISGYSQSYISSIQGDPAFAELVAYYSAQKESIFVDAQERLRALGLDATEKLHEQLHDPNKSWTPGQLMELIDMALVKPATAKNQFQGPGPSAGGFSLEVKFVGAGLKESPLTIDANYTETSQER